MGSENLLVSVPAALAAAAAFGTAGVLQHRATHETRRRRPFDPALLVDLIHRPAFCGGVLAAAVGFAFQVTALRFGPLILVQPLLVTGVLFYIGVAAAFGHRHLDRRLVIGALMALAGISGFLVVSRPANGHGEFTSAAALPLGLGLVVVVLVCVLTAARVRREVRAVPLAVATSVCYGVTAGLVRSMLEGGDGGWALLHHWELYAVAVIGPAGFLLNQNAFQNGTVGSLALAIITVGDPLVAIGVGVAWLGESISAQPAELVFELLALAVMVAGVALLAVRAQHLAERIRDSGATVPEEAAT